MGVLSFGGWRDVTGLVGDQGFGATGVWCDGVGGPGGWWYGVACRWEERGINFYWVQYRLKSDYYESVSGRGATCCLPVFFVQRCLFVPSLTSGNLRLGTSRQQNNATLFRALISRVDLPWTPTVFGHGRHHMHRGGACGHPGAHEWTAVTPRLKKVI